MVVKAALSYPINNVLLYSSISITTNYGIKSIKRSGKMRQVKIPPES
jgi:hypothetical protein